MPHIDWNINFEVAGLCVLFVILICYLQQKRIYNLLSRLYICIIIDSLITMLFNIITVFSLSYPTRVPFFINQLVNIIYLSFLTSLPLLISIYILELLGHLGKFRESKLYIPFALPWGISIILILLNPFFNTVFYLNTISDASYHWNIGMYILYASAIIYLIFTSIILFFNSEETHRPQRFLAFYYMLGSIVCIFLQLFFPKTLLIGFISTLAIIIMYLTFQHPGDFTDNLTGILYNRNAFIFSVGEKIRSKASFTVIGIYVDDYDILCEHYSEKCIESLIYHIAKNLLRIAPEGNVYRMDSMSFIVSIVDNDAAAANKILSQVNSFFGNLESFSYDKRPILLSATQCCMFCPEDADKLEEIIDTVDLSIMEARENGRGNIIYAKDHIYNREKKIEELTRQKQMLEVMTLEAKKARFEAERADNAKSNFLANMSHEIRTPMNAILGMSELISKDDINDTVREHIGNIKSAGSSLLGIINDILDISKIDSGNFEIIEDNYLIGPLINETEKIISGKVHEKGLELICKVDDTIPCELYGDKIRLRQIIINLLSNAVKFTESGTIRISVEYSYTGQDIILCVSVSDTGIGIRPENLDKMFHMFQRIESRQNRYIEGTGLGLTICKNLLEMMDGSIHVESEYGSGSTFSFRVPQKVINQTPLKDSSPEDAAAHTTFTESFTAPDARILVVDDNKLNLAVAKGLLLPYQIQVETAQSGMACLELLTTHQFDLILMDHMMPEMDGIETLKQIRLMKNKHAASTHVIALTANAVNGMKEMFLDAGFEDYISKPIDIPAFDKLLRTYLPTELIHSKQFEDAPPAFVSDKEFPNIPGIDTVQAMQAYPAVNTFTTALLDFKEQCPSLLFKLEQSVRRENQADYETCIKTMYSMTQKLHMTKLNQLCNVHIKAIQVNNFVFIRNNLSFLLHAFNNMTQQIHKQISK